MKPTLKLSLGAVLAAHLLAGCGGSSNDSTPEPAPPPPVAPPATQFSKSGNWTFVLPGAGQSLCYDFEAGIESAACTGTAWDLKVTSGGRSATFFTNSGSSGTGGGGSFGGPFEHTWADLSTWTSGTTDPAGAALPARVFLPDSASGVFSGSNGIASSAFEYGLGGSSDHLLYPSFRTFLITTASGSASAEGAPGTPVYALQVISYYGGTSGTASGYPTIRWIDRSDSAATVQEATYNATAGWVYVDLATGTETTETGTWQIAFNRYTIKLNGGTSGTGTVAGFIGRTPTAYYDSEGKPIAATLTTAQPAATLADLTATDLTAPATANAWVKDSLSSALAPAYRGTYPNALDYGWYKYYPTAPAAAGDGLPAVAHLLGAQPTRAGLVRSGEGTGYTRLHVQSITYGDPSSATSPQTWVIGYDNQPATAP